MERLELIKEKLNKYNQEHLLSFYDELNQEEKENLLNQIYNIDLELVNKIYEKIINKEEKTTDDEITPIPFMVKDKLIDEQKKHYEQKGIDIIKSGKLAAVTMAGGQGTRLGHNGPKGTFKLNVKGNKYIFEILCESLKRVKEKYGVYIPWYIMTSRENNDATVKFFEEQNYFGYDKSYITFFKQGQLPMVDLNGKILLEEKSKVREAADGHGGIFEAMHKNNIVEDMKKRNIKWAFIGGVDNILVKMADPILIGMAEDKEVLIACKSLAKVTPDEKIGAFCKKDGKPYVIEYTEISDEMANAKDENGEYLYGEGHILCNLFNIKALEMLEKEKLEYHSAFKKSNYIDESGIEVQVSEPNAYKFEAFIFDAFERVDDLLILRGNREDEFAPVKNLTGIDSAESATKLYNDWCERYNI